jgi:hypothetical protein
MHNARSHSDSAAEPMRNAIQSSGGASAPLEDVEARRKATFASVC